MDAAIKDVLAGSADSINIAARNHGIPPTTQKTDSLEELWMELISAECIKIMNEQQRKKEHEAIEKEEREKE